MKQIKWIKMDSFTGIFQRYWPKISDHIFNRTPLCGYFQKKQWFLEMAKPKLTPAEKQAWYCQKNVTKVKESDPLRKKTQRTTLKENPEKWKEYRTKENERITLLGMKKKNNVASESSSNQTPESSCNADLSTYKPYKTTQALGKTVRWAMRSLPHSPCKNHHIVLTLANKVECTVRNSEDSFQRKKNSFSIETKASVLDFYENSNVTWQAPGKRDRIIKRVNGIKEYIQTKCLLCSLREAHSLYLQAKRQSPLWYSTFCKLRPDHIHLFGKIPESVCICQVHENFCMLLVALNSHNKEIPTDFHSFLDKVVCSAKSKKGMSLECDKCSESADMYSAFTSPEEVLEDIKFYQWQWNKENQTEKSTLLWWLLWRLWYVKITTLQLLNPHICQETATATFWISPWQCWWQRDFNSTGFSENISFTEQNAVQSGHWTNK